MKISKDVLDLIRSANSIALFCHVKPDGDAIGSMTALYLALTNNKSVDMYCDDDVEESCLNVIKCANKVRNTPKSKNYDLSIALDCSDLRRLGEMSKIFFDAKHTLNIDHHTTNDRFAKTNEVIIVSSTCEIVYNILLSLGYEITREIATSLYSGIATDTGCFMHDNTTSDTHLVAAKLIECGADYYKANVEFFKKKTFSQLSLLSIALSKIERFYDGKLSIMSLTLADFKKTNTKETDTTGFVNYVVNMDNTEVGVIISEEKKNLFAISFRSAGNVDVGKIALTFGGGGHKMASGAKTFGSINTVKQKIISACENIL